ncbi:MAG: hypothetical protein AAFR70_15040 [Pseudomonadota bacterium]
MTETPKTQAEDTPVAKRAGGRPTLPLEQRRTERISFGVTNRQKATFLVNAAEAGLSSNDFARTVLCATGGRAALGGARTAEFELVDALGRIGADLARLRFIADETGIVPDELSKVIARLDAKLDHLIVGTEIAKELAEYRAKLAVLAERLEASDGMTERARGMITRLDAVVTKVLSA